MMNQIDKCQNGKRKIYMTPCRGEFHLHHVCLGSLTLSLYLAPFGLIWILSSCSYRRHVTPPMCCVHLPIYHSPEWSGWVEEAPLYNAKESELICTRRRSKLSCVCVCVCVSLILPPPILSSTASQAAEKSSRLGNRSTNVH